ncbi:MAG TPA: hypothetical protein VK553_03735 [Candidatus Nitrosopolaris rasttigaisensis]|nr:hypothetical protein [Candidatus Nitrosopolaris rasttigaisensis]
METARKESIEAAYAQLLKLSLLSLTLQALSNELRDAFQAIIAVNSIGELLDQIAIYPALLTQKAIVATDQILDQSESESARRMMMRWTDSAYYTNYLRCRAID